MKKRDFERYIKSMNAWERERERERVREIEGELLAIKIEMNENSSAWKLSGRRHVWFEYLVVIKIFYGTDILFYQQTT